MNAISYRRAWPALAGFVTLGLASAQSVQFPIAGTGSPEISISADWDGARFLVGLQGNAGMISTVVARFVDPSGQPGPLVNVSNNGSSPRVAFGGGQHLIVWGDLDGWPDTDIYGMFVQPDGSHGAAFPISVDDTAKDVTGVAFAGDRFLVPYTRGSTLQARRVSLAGIVGPELALTSAYYPGLSAENVGSDGSSFLVAWVDDVNRHVIKARVVPTVGLPGPEFSVDASPGASNEIVSVAGTPLGYLVAYSDEVGGAGSGDWDLLAQAVSATGVAVGTPRVICSAPGWQWAPFLAADGTNNYLVTWTDERWDANQNQQCEVGERTCMDIYGRYLSSDGTPLGSAWPIVERDGFQYASPTAYGAGKYLLAWTDGSFQANGGDVYGLFVPQLPFASIYCTPKVNSLGCTPAIDYSGVPSASSVDGFTLNARNLLNNQTVIFFYGRSGADNIPFQGGTRCVLVPLKRTPAQSSGGNPPPDDCSGASTFDFNAWTTLGADPPWPPARRCGASSGRATPPAASASA
jgi:hypothetical protein